MTIILLSRPSWASSVFKFQPIGRYAKDMHLQMGPLSCSLALHVGIDWKSSLACTSVHGRLLSLLLHLLLSLRVIYELPAPTPSHHILSLLSDSTATHLVWLGMFLQPQPFLLPNLIFSKKKYHSRCKLCHVEIICFVSKTKFRT